jgi:hypothetical protein
MNWLKELSPASAAFPGEKEAKVGHPDCWSGTELSIESWLKLEMRTDDEAEWATCKEIGRIHANETQEPMHFASQLQVRCSVALFSLRYKGHFLLVSNSKSVANGGSSSAPAAATSATSTSSTSVATARRTP